MAYQKTQVVGGKFQTASGQPLGSGWLVFVLSHDENVPLPASQIVAGIPIKILLDNNGNAVPNQFLWTADILQPSKSFYTVEAFNSSGLRVWAAPQYFSLAGPNPIDLGALIPVNP